MNNINTKQIITETLAEYAADLDKNILDATSTIPGCARDQQSAQVFEDLARMEDQSITSLGNGCQWKMTGREAAMSIATTRVWDAMLKENDEAEFCEAVALVEAATK